MKWSFGPLAVGLLLAGCNAGPAPVDASGPAADVRTTAPPSGHVQPEEARAARTPVIPDEFQPFVEPRGRITQGRCHMDTCSWTRWDTLQVVNVADGEVELRATALAGQSDHAKPDRNMPDYPANPQGVDIQWDPAPNVVEYGCSRTRPMMQWGNEAPVLLALDPDSFIPGAMESAVRSYFVACHSDFSTGPGDDAVVKYGYRVAAGP